MTKRWPLFFIAAPAAISIWSGWVGLGELSGFGVVNLLPGIAHASLNTAITLPVGVEAYAAFALGVWISGKGNDRARAFARWSALGALAYGMLGQVVYHLLAAAHVTAAPWPIVVMVSCMPVVVLGFAAALTHLLREDGQPEDDRGSVSPSPSAAPVSRTVPSSSFDAAKARMRFAIAHRLKYSDNQARDEWGLTRAQATEARKQATAEAADGDGIPIDGVMPSLNGNGTAHG